MNAMILAAGRGTRLQSLGLKVPKVLVEVGGQPLLARQLGYLERQGARRVVINAHHLHQAIESFAAEYRGGLELKVVVEDRLLGTAGGVRNALQHLGDQAFVVLYGDVIVDEPLGPIMMAHRQSGALATLTVYESHDIEGKGTVVVDGSGAVTAFSEKPAATGPLEPALVNAGLYVIEPALIAGLDLGTECDFGHDLFPAALTRGERLHSYLLRAPVIDVGTPDALDRARTASA